MNEPIAEPGAQPNPDATPPETPPETPVETPPVETPPVETPPETPPVETPPAGETPPEKYELKKPEGSNLDDATLEMIALNAKEQGLSQEAAQARVDGAALHQQADLERVEGVREGWKTDSAAKFSKEDMEQSVRAMERFGNPELKEALNNSGFGDHPAWLETFVAIGKAMADDKLVLNNPAGDTPLEGKTDAEVFYPEGSKKD